MQAYSLFEPYPVSGTSIKSAAEDTRGRVASVDQVIAQLEQDHRQAVASVSGTLEESVADAPTEAVTRANDVLQQAEYAAGCLELFGTDIDTYNFESAYPRSISRLNAAYSAGLSDGFGAEYEAPADDATPEERQTANDDYTAAWRDGRRELLNVLNTEKALLDGELDQAATSVSTMLTQGPTQANVTSLWAAGVLPPYAPVLFPGIYLSGGDLPPEAQQELLQYLIDHPVLLINTPSALALVIAGLPTDIRTDIYVEQRMEYLRREGSLTGPNPGGLYEDWVRNTVENGVSIDTLLEIARDHDITPDSFDVLDGMEIITDPDGKSFFMLVTDMSGDEVRAAVLMTYILNAGTGYEGGDYSETPYSSDEVQRIIDRQSDNLWSYDEDVAFVHDNGGRLTTTPNGMLMGLGATGGRTCSSSPAARPTVIFSWSTSTTQKMPRSNCEPWSPGAQRCTLWMARSSPGGLTWTGSSTMRRSTPSSTPRGACGRSSTSTSMSRSTGCGSTSLETSTRSPSRCP